VKVSRRRVAFWLWLAFAFLVWNAVFDQVIIDAGRHYIEIATASAESNGPYLKIDDTMRPARSRALWFATASAGAILVVGVLLIRRAGLSGPPDRHGRP
jgi:presenilin-like A22 family membrane protease